MTEASQEAQEVRTIEIDADALLEMTHADWKALLRLNEGRLSADLIDLLDKAVVGGVMHRKWSDLGAEVRALNMALDELVNPTEPATGNR